MREASPSRAWSPAASSVAALQSVGGAAVIHLPRCGVVRLFSAARSFQFPSGGNGARGRQQSPEGRGSEVEEPLGPQGSSLSLSLAASSATVLGRSTLARSSAWRLRRWRPARGRGKRSAVPSSVEEEQRERGESARFSPIRTHLGTWPDIEAAFRAMPFSR
ncbi:hypothetical protein HPB50_004696 [Hyalomma asiaticum]|uniref:Uncharacterized protein n=1 Tax=Hyalomma asiaticum TaxID=266040 RepID=A0ACB7SV31_HYAAI|nr:hypothetical protein HPB50_004696 [Hyalomma asiaticum]